ncbi:hypothetical protein [Pseudophaeobacter sp.]|uniref:hypothetical protein n=1 Tax=Pseudophaeobacter sp. TaxID=1971739 RepID=UPI00329706DC
MLSPKPYKIITLRTIPSLSKDLCTFGHREAGNLDPYISFTQHTKSSPTGKFRTNLCPSTAPTAGFGEPQQRLDWLITHRNSRETDILSNLNQAPASPAELARTIYTETPEALLPAAEHNVFAHLVDLAGRGKVAPLGRLCETAQFQTLK